VDRAGIQDRSQVQQPLGFAILVLFLIADYFTPQSWVTLTRPVWVQTRLEHRFLVNWDDDSTTDPELCLGQLEN
jgi:hypothetical protein